MTTVTITFPDGYKVTVTEERVTVTNGGKSQWDKSIYFRVLPASEQAICANISKQGNDPANYLWNGSTMKPMVVRRGEGVAEAITAATATERKINAEKESERKAKCDAVKETERALVETAKAEAIIIRSQIPAGEIEVERRVTGNLDGDECCEYWAEGVELKYSDIKFVGKALATRPGAQCAFFSEVIYSVKAERLAEVKSAMEAKTSAAKAKAEAIESARSAKFAEAAYTGQPVALESWTETRRAKEGGEWGDYTFVVTEYAMQDGSTKREAINTY